MLPFPSRTTESRHICKAGSNLDLKKECRGGRVGASPAMEAFRKFKTFLELNQFTLASLRTASWKNRTRRHGNSRPLGVGTHHRVYWGETSEEPQEGRLELVPLWETSWFEILNECN